MKKGDLRSKITERVALEMEKQELSLRDLATKSKMDHGNLSRLLSGKRPWALHHIEAVATGLGCLVSELVSDYIEVPVVAEIDKGGFPYTAIGGTPLDYASIPRPRRTGRIAEVIAKTYAVRIKDDTIPPFAPGTVLVAEQESHDQIKAGDMVFYCRDNGQGSLRKVGFENGSVILTSLSPGVEELRMPRKHLNLCDKVIFVKF